MEVIGAIDQGTQSTRFTLFDKHKNVIAKHAVPVESVFPQPGWAEQDPWKIYETVEASMAIAVKAAKREHGDVNILGIGITNQRETTVAWDRVTGEPLHNAIVWHDGRTSAIVNEFVEKLGGRDAFREVTGLPLSTYFSAFKMRWLMENAPLVKKAVEAGTCCFGTIDSWLIYNLTGGASKGGVHVTDATNASRYLMMNLDTLEWDAAIAEAFGVDLAMLPRIVSNSELYGKVAEGACEGVPICGCIGDQQAATLGQKCKPGEAKNTYGTGLFLLMNTGDALIQSNSGLLTTICFKLGGGAKTQYALEGAVATGGVAVSWLRDGIGIIDGPEETEAMATSIEDTGGVVFVPAFSGLLAPHWREDARGLIIGITQYTTQKHIARAALEALCYQSRGVLDAMAADYGKPLTTLRVDGGACANAFMLQFQADILNIPIVRPRNIESTSVGAALAAGLHLGVWTEASVFGEEFTDADKVFTPAMAEEAREAKYAKWNEAVTRSFGWQK